MYQSVCFKKCFNSIRFPFVKFSKAMSEESTADLGLIKAFKDFKLSPCKLLDLPIEVNRENYVRRYIKGVLFSRVEPTPIRNPKIVSVSDSALCDILDLDSNVVSDEDFVQFVAGNKLVPGSSPLSHRYGGYQFGVWASQLGDGRAILLGEYINRRGERWELQLKGSGLTPYSRDGDGRAVLRSSIREFLASEAMHYLGVPTSRAAALVTSTEDVVIRDPLYDGHPRLESVAVLLRLSPSWFRIGSLELLAKTGETALLRQLLDFIIKEHFPEIVEEASDEKLLALLKRVFRASSDLVLNWQAVGFTHGVLNTDNMSLLGLTIDYGPFGWMEGYDPLYIPNHSDSEGRYCYARQIQIFLLNMLLLGKAVTPLLSAEQGEMVSKLLQEEANYIQEKYVEIFSMKLGLVEGEPALVDRWLDLLQETKADMTMSFRELSETPLSSLKLPLAKELWGLKRLAAHPDFAHFLDDYQAKLQERGIPDNERMERMKKVNPRYVLRNWMAEEAIQKAEEGDYTQSEMLELVAERETRDQLTSREEDGGGGPSPPQSNTPASLSSTLELVSI